MGGSFESSTRSSGTCIDGKGLSAIESSVPNHKTQIQKARVVYLPIFSVPVWHREGSSSPLLSKSKERDIIPIGYSIELFLYVFVSEACCQAEDVAAFQPANLQEAVARIMVRDSFEPWDLHSAHTVRVG
jgi:hypothetical protein